MPLDVDLVYSDIGELGRGQFRFAAGLCALNAYNAWHMLQYSFVGFAVDFECTAADQDTPHRNQCPNGQSSRCQVLTFPRSGLESTIASDFGLVCDRAYLSPLTMSLFMGGVLAGALILGGASDAFGRRRTIALCIMAMIAVTGFSAVTDSYNVYAALKFLDGVFSAGLGLASFVLVNELVGSSKRALIGNCVQASFATGIILYSLAGYYFRHWRGLTWLTTLLGAPMLVVSLWCPESPRWLLGKGRGAEAVAVLRRIADVNGASLSEKHVESAKSSPVSTPSPKKAGASTDGGSLLDLFRHRYLFIITAIQIYSWFVNSATYYGLTLAASSSGDKGNRYLSTALSGAVEIPAYVLTTLLLARLTRVWTLCGFMLAGGIALLTVIFTAPISSFLVNTQALFCKLCISASFSVIYIHGGEIFPTSIRNTSIGLVSCAARVGGILAPFLAQLGDLAPNLHFLFFGGIMLSAGLLNAKLPETKGLPLPETVQDLLKRSHSRVHPSPSSSSKKKVGYRMVATDDFEYEGDEGEV